MIEGESTVSVKQARIWAWAELEDERRRRALPTGDEAARPATSLTSSLTSGAGPGEADYTLFSLARLADGIHPLVVIRTPTECAIEYWAYYLNTKQSVRPA